MAIEQENVQHLPPSLAVTPNIPQSEQTLEQLRAEHDYWDAKVRDAKSWGVAVTAADEFRRGCAAWIARREAEANPAADAITKATAA